MPRRTLLKFREIEYFRALMLNKTVSAAAEMLHVSQPNVSQLIKQVESRLNCQLFERSKGRLIATPEAIAIYDEIHSLYDHLLIVNESIDDIVAGNLGVFGIGSSPSLGRSVIPKIISKLQVETPNLKTMVDILSVSQIADYLNYHTGSCAITIFPIDQPSITSTFCGTGKLVCILPLNHPLSKKTVITPKDLENENLISFHESSPHGNVFREFMAGINFKTPNTMVRFAETACALVEEGLGIALIDEFTVYGNSYSKLVVIPTIIPPPFKVYIHRSSSKATSVIYRRFSDLLTDFVKN
jgi:DNA-binding transcriptional LysR family regulator